MTRDWRTVAPVIVIDGYKKPSVPGDDIQNERLQLEMKISSRHWSSAFDCLSARKKKKKSLRSQDEKEKQETKRENKLWASHRSLSHGGPSSPRISLTHFDEEEEGEGEDGGKFSDVFPI